MQKGSKKDLLKILKSYGNLQGSALKADKNNLNDFRSNLKSSKSFFKSFKDASEGEIESQDSSEDFNED